MPEDEDVPVGSRLMEDIESPVTTSTERFVMRGKPAKDDAGTLAKSSVTSKPRKCWLSFPFCLIVGFLRPILNLFFLNIFFMLSFAVGMFKMCFCGIFYGLSVAILI